MTAADGVRPGAGPIGAPGERPGAGAREFTLLPLEFDPTTGVVRLRYRLTDALTFDEVIELPVPPRPAPAARLATLNRVLELLHAVAGTSYYKVAAPPVLRSRAGALGPLATGYLRDVYTHGLAEFAYRNDLPHVWDLRVEPVGAPAPAAAPVEGSGAPLVAVGEGAGAPLVAVGGGKDSIVSIEALRAAGRRPVLFAVNPNAIIEEVIAASDLPALRARRRLDPALFACNEAGAYNGHIPVTAINSLIAVAVAVWHGLGPVVMSNERSASVPNLVWQGHEINHQWSKGLAAQQGLIAALAEHAGLTDGYFSLLRPFSELHIAAMFAPTTRYDHAMTSCNRAYLLRGATTRWCGDCPKCRFVFLALAPFVDPDRLVGIVGRDLLADPAALPGYLSLAELDGHKPFECVGEVEETLVAVRLLIAGGQYPNSPVLRGISEALPAGGWPTDAQVRRVFTGTDRDSVPVEYQAVLDELAGRGSVGAGTGVRS